MKKVRDLKNAKMSTNKCVAHGKVTETNPVHRTQKILGKRINK